MESLTMKPEEIESESFRIIDREVGDHDWPDAEWQVVRRVIHTSADFDYARNMLFSEKAVPQAVAAIRDGAGIYTDTNMALAGIGKPRLLPFGCQILCHIGDSDVRALAQREGVTRSVTAMRKAIRNPNNRIFVIGNAPTALFELLRLTQLKQASPALIIGMPVGFVGAEESKRDLAASQLGIPYITNVGRKGGSNVAAAIVNALAILAKQD
ncbi:precorrin-8X methylmutase [Pelotalea chapellei]|uniref:Precorrin-8X methylmutase n=1 Tax=Pelotalea chapellei TaxID=44671 RepID=A0ABS5U672_9BACT|nr:precorrin-8X methylmutase [Pelotalea chapellei]MBT1071170.1 precorrin-8X methylmutase [Pelotalea chapellei]